MKLLGILMMGLLLVFAFIGLEHVGANRADEDYNTGLKYYKGAGVRQDYTEALKWYKKATDRGNTDSQLVVGLMYALGKGVTLGSF
jgi:hypothetical protein